MWIYETNTFMDGGRCCSEAAADKSSTGAPSHVY